MKSIIYSSLLNFLIYKIGQGGSKKIIFKEQLLEINGIMKKKVFIPVLIVVEDIPGITTLMLFPKKIPINYKVKLLQSGYQDFEK